MKCEIKARYKVGFKTPISEESSGYFTLIEASLGGSLKTKRTRFSLSMPIKRRGLLIDSAPK